MSVGILVVDNSPTWLSFLSSGFAVRHETRRSIE
jgi:hypothetical protein